MRGRNFEVGGQLGGQYERHSEGRVSSVSDLDRVLIETIGGADSEIDCLSRDRDREIQAFASGLDRDLQ